MDTSSMSVAFIERLDELKPLLKEVGYILVHKLDVKYNCIITLKSPTTMLDSYGISEVFDLKSENTYRGYYGNPADSIIFNMFQKLNRNIFNKIIN